MESNATYFSRRAREELFAAIRASHHRARRAHLDMAARYDDLARAIEAEPQSALKPDAANTEEVVEHVKICV